MIRMNFIKDLASFKSEESFSNSKNVFFKLLKRLWHSFEKRYLYFKKREKIDKQFKLMNYEYFNSIEFFEFFFQIF